MSKGLVGWSPAEAVWTSETEGSAAFPGHGKLTPKQEELRNLRREVSQLKAERYLLEKAAAYFAKGQLSCLDLWRNTEGSGQSVGCVTRSVCHEAASMPGPSRQIWLCQIACRAAHERSDDLPDDLPDGHGCLDQGDLAQGPTERIAAPLGPGQPTHPRTIPKADGRSWHHLFDGPVGKCLGQCCDGELLLCAENRTGQAKNLPDKKTGAQMSSTTSSGFTIRGVGTRPSGIQAYHIRGACYESLSCRPQNRQQANTSSWRTGLGRQWVPGSFGWTPVTSLSGSARFFLANRLRAVPDEICSYYSGSTLCDVHLPLVLRYEKRAEEPGQRFVSTQGQNMRDILVGPNDDHAPI